jgi:uncharacterized membrane protein
LPAPGTAAILLGMSSNRINSLDLMRGVVMVLMAVDHVRVFSGIPAGGPTLGIFFTRWITHFVAPAFVFLAGTGAYLYGRRVANRGKLARYLAGRGVLLILLELTVIRISWTFNFDYAHYMLAGVIWMLGCCMILLAALIWLPVTVIGGFGVVVIAAHNLLDHIAPTGGWLGQLLYFGGPIQLGAGGASEGPTLMVLYSIVPWIGVMTAGYAFGAVMLLEPGRRDRICVTIGSCAIALFLLLRSLDLYGDPRPWHKPSPMPAILRFVATNKYPASLLFLLMTLGPLILLLPFAERARGKVAGFFTTFGRVPLFYYLLHIPLIHLAAIVVSLVREGHVDPWLFANHPMMVPPPPDGTTWSLGLLYVVFAVVVAVLYLPCRWYANVKARSPGSLLRYL